MKSGLETTHGSQLERHKVKKQCAISLCREADQLTAGLRGSGFKDVLQIGGLAAQAWAVVNDLAVNLSGCVVNKSHKANAFLFGYWNKLSMSSSVISAKGESLSSNSAFVISSIIVERV